jgi:hypothetical protein
MFVIPNIFPFITKIDDEGDNGGGDQIPNEDDFVDDGFGVPYGDPDDDAHGPDSEEIKNNPAWDEILNYIPEDKRPEVLPKLKGWDDNFAKVQSEYAPYKPLLEHKVTMEDVQKAFAFANLVNTNPKALYDELGQRFGFGQGQQQVPNKEEDEDDPDFVKDQIPDLTKHPEFVKMQQTLQQFEQRAMEEAQRQEAAKVETQIESEFTALETQLKTKLSPKAREEILIRSVKIGDRTGNYSINEGYKDYASFVNQIRNSRANNSAPRVFSGNGGLPASNKPISQMDEEERAARIVAFLEASGKEP